jgi:hypothetical protein
VHSVTGHRPPRERLWSSSPCFSSSFCASSPELSSWCSSWPSGNDGPGSRHVRALPAAGLIQPAVELVVRCVRTLATAESVLDISKAKRSPYREAFHGS